MNKLSTEEWVAIVVAIALGGLLVMMVNDSPDKLPGADLLPDNSEQEMEPQTITLDSGLEIKVTRPGTGTKAEVGDAVIVNYRGRLAENDVEFDNSYDRGQPFPVILGENRVIQGWEQGLLGAQTGEARTLRIPFELAYGNNGTPDGTIPPKSDLIFDIEVLQVITAEELQAASQPQG